MVSLVKPNDRVLIAHLDGAYSMVHARPNLTFRLNKIQVPVDPIIGRPYGSIFRLVGTELIEVDQFLADERTELDSNHVPVNDNSNLFARNGAQKLTQAEIEELKKTVAPDELVSLIALNSSTFTTKTEFSQEKYLKKKRKHHITEIRIVKPSALSISRMYTGKKSDKILGIRPDTLALILSKASLRPMSQVLVLDECMGLVTASVAERLGGFGRILSPLFNVPGASFDCLLSFGLDTFVSESVIQFPIEILHRTANEIVLRSSDSEQEELAIDVTVSEFEPKSEDYNDKGRLRHPDARVQAWLHEGCDSLVIAVRFDVESTVEKCLPFLHSGGSLTVYSQYLEPLQHYALKLRQSKRAVMVQVSENWYREYQVLSNRTHPVMNMHAAGGFILSAIKVTPLPDLDMLVSGSSSPSPERKRAKSGDDGVMDDDNDDDVHS